MGGFLVRQKIDNNECSRLYHEGKTDREIADVLGVSPNRISNWRRCRHLPVHQSHRTIIRREHMITYERLYRQGYDDYKIARAAKVRPASVRHWRKRNNLPEVAV